jgi:hypothetical protein
VHRPIRHRPLQRHASSTAGTGGTTELLRGIPMNDIADIICKGTVIVGMQQQAVRS